MGLNTFHIHDTRTGAPIRQEFPPHIENVRAMAFSRDGSRLAVSGGPWTSHLFSTQTLLPAGPPLQHASWVKHLAFSQDGRWIATTDAFGRVRVWDATTSQPLTPARQLVRGAHEGWFTEDSRSLISIGQGIAFSPLDPIRPASELIAEAELLSGYRQDNITGIRPIPAEELRALSQHRPSP